MCKTNFIAYTELIKRGESLKFLHGLNFKYDPIWVQILSKEKLPSLCEVLFAMRGNSNTRSAMAIGKGSTKGSTFEGKPSTKSSCGEYCK
ncbi:hypothetical protein CR513_43482, partial [Mucuna pruriens]